VGGNADPDNESVERNAADDSAWQRFGAFLTWSAAPREDGAVAFEPPEGGRRVVVAPDLRVVD